MHINSVKTLDSVVVMHLQHVSLAQKTVEHGVNVLSIHNHKHAIMDVVHTQKHKHVVHHVLAMLIVQKM